MSYLFGMLLTASAVAATDADYQRIVDDHPDTAQGHFDIATWCGDNGMAAARHTHLRRAIGLDPDFAPARHALGYVRVGEIWLKARDEGSVSPAKSGPRNAPAVDANPPPGEPDGPAERVPRPDPDSDKRIRDAMAKWRVTLHGLRRAYLMTGNKVAPPDSFDTGAERILAIEDPLAIDAVASVLAAGPIDLRRLMVAALRRFPSDEATLNLIVTAVLDPAAPVRRDAARALAARRDEQMTDWFRMALRSREEAILTGAAGVISEFKLEDAVPDLVVLLKGDRRLDPPVTRRVLFDALMETYGRPVTIEVDGRSGRHHPKIAVVARDTAIEPRLPGQPLVERRPEFRTPIQEALIALTGQNFGFDAKAWMQWYARQEADNPAEEK